MVYQYRRGLRNVIAGIKSVISNCSNGCPSGWKDGTHETSFASQVGLEMGRTVLTLSEERILGERLSKVISPCREIGICIRINIFIDIRLRGEIWRITPNVLRIRVLVDTDVIDIHLHWERKVLEILLLERS